MRIRSAKGSLLVAGVVLLAALGTAACGGGDDKAGNANANANRSAANVNTNAGTGANANMSSANTGPNADSSQDNALRNTVEANLSRAGITGVSVSVSNGEVTLRGNIARAKLQDAMKAANDANPKRVNNQLTIQ